MAESASHTLPTYDRALMTSRVLRALARYQARNVLSVRNESGDTPIVVAFPDDLVSDLIARVRRAGDQANIVVAFDEQFAVLALTAVATLSESLDSDGHAAIHQDSTVGMLVAWLQSTPGQTGQISLSGPRHRRPLVQEMDYIF